MFHALYTAASGMTAQQINLDNIANNLANSSTSGFQSRRVQFSDLLYQNEVMPGLAATQQTTVSSGLADWTWHASGQHGDHPDYRAT
jgi:flagellar basal-body rod protein FlgG